MCLAFCVAQVFNTMRLTINMENDLKVRPNRSSQFSTARLRLDFFFLFCRERKNWLPCIEYGEK